MMPPEESFTHPIGGQRNKKGFGMIRKLTLIILLSLFVQHVSYVQAEEDEILFVGYPVVKISEGGVDRVVQKMKGAESEEVKCVIVRSEKDKTYYWLSREKTELTPVVSGGFVTFIAKNGSGYIRVTSLEHADGVKLMGETESQYDYVEHLLLGLKSVTYYGGRKQ